MNLITLLQHKNMSEYALSKKSGVPYSTISDICSGKTNIKKCNVETVYKIAQALNLTIESLIEDDSDMFDDSETITIKEYYQRIINKRKNVVLYGGTALDYLQINNSSIPLQVEVYSTTQLPYPFKTHIVKNFDKIDYNVIDGVLVSTFEQAFNDMLSDKETDYQVLDEALSNYYYLHDESFDGLKIKKKNLQRFNEEKEYAIRYYDTN